MKEFRKRLWLEVALCASFFSLIHSTIAYSADLEEDLFVADSSHDSAEISQRDFTINFNNVSIIEFIRFVSKITNLNFVFEEADLPFTVTVVSEEPVSAKNVMSALAQVLRVHDLMLLEQENNILIVKSTSVNQIPTIISGDLPDSESGNAALVTQVFRIKNANLNSLASIIRPMTSKGALIEVSNETRQLIVTDITTNVEKIASLLTSLDAPHTSLDIESYVVKNISPQELIGLTQQILTPFAEGNPLIFVPQIDTNSIFIVSTPHLIERAITVMEDLDVPPKKVVVGNKAGPGKNVFIYKTVNRSPAELLSALDKVNDELRSAPGSKTPVENAIDTAQIVKDTNSIIFIADPNTVAALKEMLAALDVVPSKTMAQPFIFRPQYASNTQIEAALEKLRSTLDLESSSDHNLSEAIKEMVWDPGTQSFFVATDPATVERLKEIFSTLDNPQEFAGKTAQSFFLYKLQNAQGNEVIKELQELAEKIPPTTIQNQNVVIAIDKITWVQSTNSLLIAGPADAIEQIKTLIVDFDVLPGERGLAPKSSFLIYRPQNRSTEEMLLAVSSTAKDLQEAGLNDPNLFFSLASMKLVPTTDSLVFTGSPETLTKVKEMLDRIDNGLGAIQQIGKITFLVYKLQYVSGEQLISAMKNFALHLENSQIDDKELAKSLEDVRYIKETNSLLFIGPSPTLERINAIAQNFDNPNLVHAPPPTPARPSATYIVYNPKSLSGPELISILCEFKTNLKNSGVNDPGLFDVINNLKWIDKTSSLLISGDEASVEKVKELLIKFDIPGKETGVPSIEEIDNTSFLVYKLQYHQGSDIRDALKQVGVSLAKGAAGGQSALMEAINSLQWIQVTNSLLGTGQQDVLIKLKELIQNLDVPLRQVFIEVLVIETAVSDAQNFGLMWGSQVQYMNKTILSTGNFPVPGGSTTSSSSTTPSASFSNLLQGINATNTPKGGSTGVPFTTGFDLGVIGDIIMHKGKSFISLGSLVNALQQDSNSTILLNPKIITQDNQQSIIFVGQNVPYTGAVVNTVGTSQQTTGNIEYRDVGVSLTITPILGDNDVVTLDIVNDISEVVATQNGGSVGSTQLTGLLTNHTHMETRVQVPDQHFVALSGMIQDSKARYRSAIPCLGGLPVVGALFSENDRLATKSNVIIFLKPYIINSYEQYKQITEHQEWIYKNSAVLPVLKEEFDAALDVVKTPDNE